MRTTSLPYGPDSVTWKVNMEPTIALGGGRALLLQVLHPLVAAGVEQHSNFEADPFRRGFQTIDVMLKLAFGDAETSRAQADLLRRIHTKIEGVSSDGVPYRALDVPLLLWVWATLVDASMRMYEATVRAFEPGERERYYEEQKLVAYASGVPEGACPSDVVAFDAYLAGAIASDLRPTSVAKIVAYAGRHPPLPWPLGPLAGMLTTLVTAGLLPEHLREALGYRWSRGRDRAMRALFAVLRVLSAVTPRRVRHVPNRYLINRRTPLGLWSGRPVRLPAELRAGLHQSAD
jgi:uncharacterized protein (DUF2236 family)